MMFDPGSDRKQPFPDPPIIIGKDTRKKIQSSLYDKFFEISNVLMMFRIFRNKKIKFSLSKNIVIHRIIWHNGKVNA